MLWIQVQFSLIYSFWDAIASSSLLEEENSQIPIPMKM